MSAKEPQSRIAACTRLIDSGAGEPQIRAELFTLRGLANVSAKNYEDAIRDYDQALDLDANHLKTYLNRGILLRFQQKYDLAQSDFDKLIELGGRQLDALPAEKIDEEKELTSIISDGHYYRGLLWLDRQEREKADQDFEKTITINSKVLEKDHEDVQALLQRAQAYEKEYRYVQAKADYGHAASLIEARAANASEPDKLAALQEFAKELHKQEESAGTEAVLEARFGQYLEEIQRKNAYPNWSQPPYDVFRRVHLHESVPEKVAPPPPPAPSLTPAPTPQREPDSKGTSSWVYAAIILAVIVTLLVGIGLARGKRATAAKTPDS